MLEGNKLPLILLAGLVIGVIILFTRNSGSANTSTVGGGNNGLALAKLTQEQAINATTQGARIAMARYDVDKTRIANDTRYRIAQLNFLSNMQKVGEIEDTKRMGIRASITRNRDNNATLLAVDRMNNEFRLTALRETNSTKVAMLNMNLASAERMQPGFIERDKALATIAASNAQALATIRASSDQARYDSMNIRSLLGNGNAGQIAQAAGGSLNAFLGMLGGGGFFGGGDEGGDDPLGFIADAAPYAALAFL